MMVAGYFCKRWRKQPVAGVRSTNHSCTDSSTKSNMTFNGFSLFRPRLHLDCHVIRHIEFQVFGGTTATESVKSDESMGMCPICDRSAASLTSVPAS